LDAGLVPEPRCPQEDFKSLAGELMRHVSEIHNEFGRLFVQPIDKRELAARSA
jgi:hypothetical protein